MFRLHRKTDVWGVIECIFVDDCGNDRSMTILEELLAAYSGPITFSVIHHDRNRGLSAARNTGIRAAHGDYIYFLDSDDTITPDCIERLAALAEKYPGVDLVQGFASRFTGVYEWDIVGKPEYSDNFRWIRKSILEWHYVSIEAWNKLISLRFIVKHDLFFEPGIIHEDVPWNFLLSKYVRKIAFCKDVTYHYRENPGGIMANIHDERKYFEPIIPLLYENLSGPYICYELFRIADLIERFVDGKCLNEFIVSLNYPHNIIFMLFKLKSWMNNTSKFSPNGIMARCCFHLLVEFINLTYKGKWNKKLVEFK